jgi:hypothetical protein
VKCPKCKHEWKLPGPQAGGKAKVAKGFAVAGQPDAAARKRAWKTRKANKPILSHETVSTCLRHTFETRFKS